MSKMLLIHPALGTGDKKRPPDIFDPNFPWGLGYISGTLKTEGYDIEIFDIYAQQWNRTEVIERLRDKEYHYALITGMATQYLYIKWLVAQLKRINKQCIIILGGHLATFSYEVVLNNTAVDICVIGEGEITIVDLLKNIDNLKAVKGIAIRDGKKIIKTPPRPLIENLDAIPRPAYDLFRMDIYKNNKMYTHNKSAALYTEKEKPRVMAMIINRGCPFECDFCGRVFKNIRMRSVDSIISEIDFFRSEYGINAINFVDELLFFDEKNIDLLAKELGKRGIIWNGQARIDTINLDKLSFYKENGLISIGYGAESGSNLMLKRMNKKITTEEIKKTLRRTIDAGIHLKLTLVFGYLGENHESVSETIEMFKELKHPGRRFCIFTPLPGSKVYDYVKKQGFIVDEDKYLASICEGYWRRIINVTEFSDEEYDRVRINAEKQMKENYKKYILTSCGKKGNEDFFLCEEDFEKDFLEKTDPAE